MGVVPDVDAENRLCDVLRTAMKEKRRQKSWGKFTINIEFIDGKPKKADVIDTTTVSFTN